MNKHSSTARPMIRRDRMAVFVIGLTGPVGLVPRLLSGGDVVVEADRAAVCAP